MALAIPAMANLPFLKDDPQLTESLGWNLLPNGMLIAGYDLNGNGKADFYAIRMVLRSFVSKRSVAQETKNWPGKLTLFAKHDPVAGINYFYITEKQALLYALDPNEDQAWDLIYKDPLEDGLNGNERFYDSPGEMLSTVKKGNLWMEFVLTRLCTCQKTTCPLRQTAKN